MKINNGLATIIIIATIIILTFLVIFVAKLIISAEPKQKYIDKNIENQLDSIINNYDKNEETNKVNSEDIKSNLEIGE